MTPEQHAVIYAARTFVQAAGYEGEAALVESVHALDAAGAAHNRRYDASWHCRTHGRPYGECAGSNTDGFPCAAAPGDGTDPRRWAIEGTEYPYRGGQKLANHAYDEVPGQHACMRYDVESGRCGRPESEHQPQGDGTECPGIGPKPTACGRDHDHAAHPLGRPPMGGDSEPCKGGALHGPHPHDGSICIDCPTCVPAKTSPLADRRQRAREAFWDTSGHTMTGARDGIEEAVETATRVQLSADVMSAARGAFEDRYGGHVGPIIKAAFEAAGFEVVE